MRAIIAIDDDLYARAREITGLTEDEALVREAFQALVEREAETKPAYLQGESGATKLRTPRQVMDALRKLTAGHAWQEQSAGDFIRDMRDSDRC